MQTYSFLLPQFGIETSYAATVPATRMLLDIVENGWEARPEQTREESGVAGVGAPVRSMLNTEMSKGSAKCKLTYDGFGYFIQSQMGPSTKQTLASGAYQNVWSFTPYAPETPQSYTCEFVSTGRMQRVSGLVFDGIKINSTREKQIDMTAQWFAQAIQGAGSGSPLTPSSGQANVQVITITGGVSAGTFILILDGQPTAAIAYNAAASAVQTAIRAVGGVWAGAAVSGSAGSWTVTISGQGRVPAMLMNWGGLTGGSDTTATISVSEFGGMKQNPGVVVQPGDIAVSFGLTEEALQNAPSYANVQLATDIDLSAIYNPVWTQSAAGTSYQFVNQKDAKNIKDTVSMKVGFDTDTIVNDLIQYSQANQPTFMYVRIAFTGAQIGSTGFYQTLQFDFPCEMKWNGQEDSGQNVWQVDIDLIPVVDVNGSGFYRRITAISTIQDYSAT